MSSLATLRTGLKAYWSFDNKTAPYTQWDAISGNHLLLTTGTMIDGKFGSAVDLGLMTGTKVFYVNVGKKLTLTAWIKPVDSGFVRYFDTWFDAPVFLGLKIYSGAFFHLAVQWRQLVPDLGWSIIETNPLNAGWNFLRLEIDCTLNNSKLVINESQQKTNAAYVSNIILSPTTVLSIGRLPAQGSGGSIDELAIWDRLLTADEIAGLYNDGHGIPLLETIEAAEDEDEVTLEECPQIPCCDDKSPFTYDVNSASSSGAENGTDCSVVPLVSFDPPTGSYVSFPTFVTLFSSIAGATIYYTTDGTQPTSSSSVYENPVEVTGPGVTIRAYATYGGCDGPEAQASYVTSDFAFQFRYFCQDEPMVDQSGQWNDFAPNGTKDHEWRLDMTVPAAGLDIAKLIIWETNAAGEWNTGQVWATQQYNDSRPWGPDNFNTWPLVMFESAVTQVNSAYTEHFCTDVYAGALTAGDWYWTMFGNIFKDITSAYFKCQIHLEDGTVYTQIISAEDCLDPDERVPALCTSLQDPVVSVVCDTVTITWNTADTVDSWELYRRDEAGVVITLPATYATGTYDDTDVSPGKTYQYYVVRQVADCPVQTSALVGIPVPNIPFVDAEADMTTITQGQTVTFTVTGKFLGAGGACATGDVVVEKDGVPYDTITPDPSTGEATWTDAPDSTAVYEFKGCNSCQDADSVVIQITVVELIECDAVYQPATIQINPSELADELTTNYMALPCNGFAIQPWNGQMTKNGALCSWGSPENTCDDPDASYLYIQSTAGVKLSVAATCEHTGGFNWLLSVYSWASGESNLSFFYGTKSGGATPLGTYTDIYDPTKTITVTEP